MWKDSDLEIPEDALDVDIRMDCKRHNGVWLYTLVDGKLTPTEAGIAYEADQYGRDRVESYPKLEEQFDLLWHAIDDGTLDKTSDFYTKLKKVKDDNPK
tara:strand:- start:70 stop:366 length:297 start_codon:yes stop_codon:yes gene_type:complete